jgi:cystathionine beta-synthase
MRRVAARWRDETPAGNRPARIVTLFPDSGHRYLSTIFNDDWMREKGFLE